MNTFSLIFTISLSQKVDGTELLVLDLLPRILLYMKVPLLTKEGILMYRFFRVVFI